MSETSEQVVRGAIATVAEIVLEVVVGAGLLVLFVVALAWDPLDRRLGFHTRRRDERLNSRSSAPIALSSPDGAYGIGPTAAA